MREEPARFERDARLPLVNSHATPLQFTRVNWSALALTSQLSPSIEQSITASAGRTRSGATRSFRLPRLESRLSPATRLRTKMDAASIP